MNQLEVFTRVKKLRRHDTFVIGKEMWGAVYRTPPSVLINQWTGERGALHGKRFTISGSGQHSNYYFISRYE